MKILLIVFCSVAGAVLLIGLAGVFLPATRIVTGSREISASRQRVWALLTDLSAQPTWRPEIDRVEVLDATPGRERWIERPRRRPAITFATERMSPPVEWVIAYDGPAQGRWTGRVEEIEGGRVRIRVEEVSTVSNPWMRVAMRIVFALQAFVDRHLAGLARAAEQKSPRPYPGVS